jgi:hypothetical protein
MTRVEVLPPPPTCGLCCGAGHEYVREGVRGGGEV